jgi:hypothetical protein
MFNMEEVPLILWVSFWLGAIIASVRKLLKAKPPR